VNFLDFLLIIVIGWSILSGFMAGFARVGVGFAATILGILFGFWFYNIPAAWVRDYFSARIANLIGFFIVFALLVLVGAIVSGVLSRIFKWAGLSWVDRLLGGAFGFVRGVVLSVAVVTVITAFAPTPPPQIIAESRVMPYVAGAAGVMATLAPSELKHDFRESVKGLRRYWDEHVPKKLEKLKAEPV
jgi:membrane protein required for colicin V production